MADQIAALISQLALSNETILVLVILALVIVGAVVVVVTSRPILDIFPYLNPIAKVRARKGRLLSDKQIVELADTNSVEDVTNYLRGLDDYLPYLNEYSLEKSLDVQMADTYKYIATIAPEEIKKPFEIISTKTDIANIKALLTAKAVGFTNERTSELLIPSGSLYDTLDKLVDASSVTDVVAGLDGTEYSDVLKDAIPQYEESNSLLPFSNALDKFYLHSLLHSTEVPGNENTEKMYAYIGAQVDIANIKLIIRAKVDGLDYDVVSPYLINEGYQLREWKLKELMESQDVSGVISSLDGTKYSDILSNALTKYNETGSVSVFENALDSYFAEYSHSLSLEKPLGVGPIIGFLSGKEKEIKNLKIISRAKREAGFPNDKLQEMLV
ncbi:ATP synthase A1 subunit C [Methanobrevibacter sp. 87.7]|uniref:V-type ATP synthase subunit C n=1 Tax=Methanobrevibacter sp. 87.7 TaxID=387957 RepID=UPI000B50D186|nr:V-type ATP synthase subunit C [Methanobrevibacter sp. 87.7]OWT33096.1 ATP synthase A1 subunit C [Methanobrevibacter sp. 87.7]